MINNNTEIQENIQSRNVQDFLSQGDIHDMQRENLFTGPSSNLNQYIINQQLSDQQRNQNNHINSSYQNQQINNNQNDNDFPVYQPQKPLKQKKSNLNQYIINQQLSNQQRNQNNHINLSNKNNQNDIDIPVPKPQKPHKQKRGKYQKKKKNEIIEDQLVPQIEKKEKLEQIQQKKEIIYKTIQCPNCDKNIISLEQHQLECSQKSKLCEYCNDDYPDQLIEQHLKICEKKKQFLDIFDRPRQLQPQQQQSNQQFIQQSNQMIQLNSQRLRILILQKNQNIQEIEQIIAHGTLEDHSKLTILADYNRSIDYQIMQINRIQMQNLAHIQYSSSISNGLTQEQIQKFPSSKYIIKNKKEIKDVINSECTICLMQYQEGEMLKYLDCMHSYHTECIDIWFKKSSHCPICQKDMKQFV